MKCPHCLVAAHETFESDHIEDDVDGRWGYSVMTCPECNRAIIRLELQKDLRDVGLHGYDATPLVTLIHPRASARPPCPPEVLEEFAEDYREACLVVADSAKASAALSRRCLQNLLREKEQVGPSDLAAEIQVVLDKKKLPSHLAQAIDGIRNIGNFAAHPNKSKRTGEVLPVEPGEAEWNLDTLEAMFDFYFVQPAVLMKKRDALNKKLKETGKPPMKG